jgi:lipopolysaccharide transport system ATP-binding protein
VYLNAAVLGLRKAEIDAAFDEIIAFAELERFVDQKLKNFSSGMHVRLAFSVAIKARADVYLMDEVLAVGDLAFQQKCFDVFRRFRHEGRTIVLVSHDLASIRNYCERTLYLKDGEVVALGPTAEVLDRYVYEDRAVALPQAPLGTDAAGIRSPVRVVGARVLDRAGRPQRQLVSGDAMAIELDYAADSGAANAVLELTLSDPRGAVLFTVDSAAFDLRPPAAAGTLRFGFPSPALGAGHVVIAAAARSRDGTVFHRRDRLAEFDVLAGADDRGLVRMPVTAAFVGGG